jgi:hypothetical protein
MEGNTEYKSFALIEQYNSEETGYYNNIVKTLAATKNDCSAGTVSSFITLTANVNQFVSAISVADANAQADSWLAANVQAYANNLGLCTIRPSAWRGINPSCVLEPSITLLDFDYMVVRYKWAEGAGQDFDTFTGFVNTGTEWDGKYMGYGHGNGNILPNNSTVANSYIMWAGDNTNTIGVESCLVNISNMTLNYPDLNSIQLRMAGVWYNSVGTGNIDIEFVTYKGGTMSQSGYDFINTGGVQVQKLNFSKYIPKPPNWVNDIDAITNIGYITYSKSSYTGQIVITY